MTPQRAHAIREAIPFNNLLWNDLLYRVPHGFGVSNPFGRGERVDLFLTRPLVEESN